MSQAADTVNEHDMQEHGALHDHHMENSLWHHAQERKLAALEHQTPDVMEERKHHSSQMDYHESKAIASLPAPSPP